MLSHVIELHVQIEAASAGRADGTERELEPEERSVDCADLGKRGGGRRSGAVREAGHVDQFVPSLLSGLVRHASTVRG